MGEAYLENQVSSLNRDSEVPDIRDQENVRYIDETTEIRKIRQDGKIIEQRMNFINKSEYRNDIQIVAFDPDKPSFGQGGAKIIEAVLLDVETDTPFSYVVGGEIVKFYVTCRARKQVVNPIIGFYCKNNLRQCE